MTKGTLRIRRFVVGGTGLLVLSGATIGRAPAQAPTPNRATPKIALPAPVQALEFSRDGRRLLVARAGGSGIKLEIWNVKRRAVERSFTFQGELRNLGVSADFRRVAVALVGGYKGFPVQLWDLQQGKRIRSFQLAGNGTRVGLSADGKTIFIGNESYLACFDANSGKVLEKQGDDVPAFIHDVRVSPNGRYLALSGYDARNAGVVCKLDGGRKIGRCIGMWGGLDGEKVSWSPDGAHLAILDEFNITVVRFPVGKVVFSQEARNQYPAQTLAITRDNKWLINAVSGDDKSPRSEVWSLRTGKKWCSLQLEPPVQCSPTEDVCAAAGPGGRGLRVLRIKEVLHPVS